MENKSNQTIKGNENFQQNIVNQTNNYIVNGITEEKARSISEKISRDISSQYFELSQNIANSRMDEFENTIMNKLSKIENGLNNFVDPSFVYQYRNAQIQAAQTDDVNNYNLLCELLAHRSQKKENKFTKTGVDGAINIVNKLSDSVLSALTILNFFSNSFYPTSCDINDGLKTLDNLFKVIIKNSELPNGYQWFDQLDILQAIRINQIYPMKKFNQIMENKLSKYLVLGIQLESENYKKLLNIEKNIPFKLMVSNPLLPNYIKLSFDLESYDEVTINYNDSYILLKEVQPQEVIKKSIEDIVNLYDKDEEKLKKVKEKAHELMNSYKYIKMVGDWWNKIPHACEITAIGRVLGHANAKKCYPDFPDLD